MKGVLYILLAEFSFALSSVFAKFALVDSDISGLQITFFRFLFGSTIAFIAIKQSGESFRPVSARWITWRALFNTFSAMAFFYSLKYTTVTNANMLGMTYPLWVVIFAPLLIGELFRKRNLAYVGVALVGIFLIVHPDFSHVNMGDVWAFVGGVTASVAVISLRQARKFDTTNLIIFYLMSTGLVINGLWMVNNWVEPTPIQWVYILVSAMLGLIAQVVITHGYKFIEAAKGSIVSSSRIVMAGAMGIMFFSENFTIQLIAGAILILSAQLGLLFDKLRFVRNVSSDPAIKKTL